ncbi:MAG TPA: hypothetical protein VGB24_18715 [Longimicrobium sp.]|jgi:hypothetical protein|uniref:hypothetical protein n=1 Tax=Longimicrobium sp. TaxID=2029185 RepID=UPI002EDA2B8E
MAKKSGTSSIPQDDVGDGPGTTRGRSRAADAAAEAMAPGGAKPARGGKAPGTGVAVGDQPASVTRTRAPKADAAVAKSATKPAAKTAAKPASKPASKSGKKRETFDETVARRKQQKEIDQLQADLRAFAIARPGGWNHEDWLGFLDSLRQKGHDLSAPEEIGSRLERERLGVVLSGIQGIGPKRVDALVNRFHTLYSARHASVEEFAGAGLPRADAERVLRELQERFP